MSRWRSVWLVARREILERGRSRGYFLVGAVHDRCSSSGSFVAARRCCSATRRDQDRRRRARRRRASRRRSRDRRGSSTGTSRSSRSPTRRRPTRPSAEESGRRRRRRARPTCPVPGDDPVRRGAGRSCVDAARRRQRSSRCGSQAVLAEAGVDQADLRRRSRPRPSTSLEPQTDEDQARFLFANIGTILILVGIFCFGFRVLTGVVEEKQSRVVEVVLSTVRPRDLLMGKVLGIGILGLVQLAVFVVAGARRGRRSTDRLELPATTPAAIVLLAVWFVLGYMLYSTALGFLGALASRMEEASNASTPVTMIAMVSYFVAIFVVVNDPDGLVAQIATFLPPSAPMVVPLRAAFDAIGPWEIVRLDRGDRGGDLGLFVDRRPGLRGRGAPDGGPDEAPRRMAVGRGSDARAAAGAVSCSQRLEQAGQCRRRARTRPAAPSSSPLPDARRRARPGPWRCRSGRRGSPRFVASSAVASSAAGGREAVAGAELALVELDPLAGRRGDPGARPARRAAPRSPAAARPTRSGDDHARDARRRAERSQARRSARPASRRWPTARRRRRARRPGGSRAWSTSSSPARTWPRRPARRTHRRRSRTGGRPAARESAATRSTRRLALRAVGRRRLVDRGARAAVISRTPGPGGGRRAGQHEVDVQAGPRPGRRRQPAVVRPAPAAS